MEPHTCGTPSESRHTSTGAPSPANATIFTDPKRLQQILKNLLSNAFKFTFRGGISVALHPSADGAAAELTVRDHLVGAEVAVGLVADPDLHGGAVAAADADPGQGLLRAEVVEDADPLLEVAERR